MERLEPPYAGIVVELRDIVFHSSPENFGLPPNTFKSILHCGATADYQCGRLTRPAYYARLATDFELSEDDIREAFSILQSTVHVRDSVLQSLRAIKDAWHGKVKIFALTNMSDEDYQYARQLLSDWSIFDRVFLSAEMGMRKPEQRTFFHVFSNINISPERLVFADGDTDSVLVAMSLGARGALCDSTSIGQSLSNLFGDPICRGKQFLQNRAGRLDSVTHSGIVLKENFAQLLILEASSDRDLIYLDPHKTTWNYFIGTPLLTQTKFPDDADTTSLALTILGADPAVPNGVMDEILRFRSQDGIVQTFFTDFKNRVDPVVCCNVLSLFFDYGRGDEVKETLLWVRQVLLQRAYLNGTAFYPMPEAFLFFFERLTQRLAHIPRLHAKLRDLLRQRVRERIGIPVDSISLAMRLITCQAVGIHDHNGLALLRSKQLEDGGWELGTVYHYASKKLRIGNRGLSTALAIRAFEGFQDCDHTGLRPYQ
ncbi:hypothetical protein P168DRAFT_298685 [Aspergillus campestris IBT 28561]|uniref:HAD-like protein n=1 Tax=Aspergillus campestris (strain IBT 28561) TaxID=1392248 RepID=A0A2I1CWL8_ASPC2|nr:uncharacterized protein P168DRAFT_298685 [Aspergillus campestris IBT 28561]PKY02010.1 hypothetical protein P168DRAFT_298685 [Aspergillus campestris IBT 28561]